MLRRTNQPDVAAAVGLGSKTDFVFFGTEAEADTGVPPDGRTDMESIIGLII